MLLQEIFTLEQCCKSNKGLTYLLCKKALGQLYCSVKLNILGNETVYRARTVEIKLLSQENKNLTKPRKCVYLQVSFT
jgi:hypothetical protein